MTAIGCARDPSWAPCGACGCVDGVSPIPDRWEIPGIYKSSVCPRRSIPRDWPFMADLYIHYDAGHLWSSGGVREQPAIYLDLMRLIANWISKLNA